MRGSLELVAGTFAIVLLLCARADARDGSKPDAHTSPSTTDSKVPAVFNVPPTEELAKIKQGDLRSELLRMVHEDQVARRGGT